MFWYWSHMFLYFLVFLDTFFLILSTFSPSYLNQWTVHIFSNRRKTSIFYLMLVFRMTPAVIKSDSWADYFLYQRRHHSSASHHYFGRTVWLFECFSCDGLDAYVYVDYYEKYRRLRNMWPNTKCGLISVVGSGN
jgi:hypothetical protein